MFLIVKCLVIEFGGIGDPDSSLRLLEDNQFEWLIDTLSKRLNSLASDFRQAVVPEIAEFLKEIAIRWQGSFTLLLAKIPPNGDRAFVLPGAPKFKELNDEIRNIVLNRCVEKIISALSNPATLSAYFEQTIDASQFQLILIDPDSPLWKERKWEVLGHFQGEKLNKKSQESAFYILTGIAFRHSVANDDFDKNKIFRIIEDNEIRSILWKSATHYKLSPGACQQLVGVKKLFDHYYLTYDNPVWLESAEVMPML